MENEKKFNLSLLFNVLFWGGLWGIVEATLGTILHLPAFEGAGLFLGSSAIIIPIAYFLMANCYKRTNSFYSVYLMGVLAALIKLSVGFVIGFINKVYNPAIYIVVESLAMGTALLIIRPTNVLSFKTLGAMIMANTIYQFLFLVIRMASGGANVFESYEVFVDSGAKYLFTINCIAIIYTFAVGAAAFGLFKLAEKFNWKVNFSLDKIIHSPITASVSVVLALVLTIVLAAVK